MLLSVTSRPGISTFGYNKNNKKVGKSAFWNSATSFSGDRGVPLALTFSLRGEQAFSPLSSSFSTTFFCHLFLPGSEVPGIYSPLPEAWEGSGIKNKSSFASSELCEVSLTSCWCIQFSQGKYVTSNPGPPACSLQGYFVVLINCILLQPTFLPTIPSALSGSLNTVSEITASSEDWVYSWSLDRDPTPPSL